MFDIRISFFAYYVQVPRNDKNAKHDEVRLELSCQSYALSWDVLIMSCFHDNDVNVVCRMLYVGCCMLYVLMLRVA